MPRWVHRAIAAFAVVLIATLLYIWVFADDAEAQTTRPAPSLEVDIAICGGATGAVAAATSISGVGVIPAVIYAAICAIAINDWKWHQEGNSHGSN